MAEKRDKDTNRQRKRLTLRFGTERPEKIGFTEDISREGLFIKAVSPYPPNTKLKIELTTSDNSIIKIEGVVMWAKKVPVNLMQFVKKGGMGIRIICISEGEDIYAALIYQSKME